MKTGYFDNELTSVDAFGVSMDSSTMMLALALVDRAGCAVAAVDVLRAASAIRLKVGGNPTARSQEAIEFNQRIPVGSHVQGTIQRETYLDPETIVTKTASPAFDTPAGPLVCLVGVDDAVRLEGLTPVSVLLPRVQEVR